MSEERERLLLSKIAELEDDRERLRQALAHKTEALLAIHRIIWNDREREASPKE